jgi:hypothetical protein
MRAVLCLASVLLVLALVGASEPTEADAEAKFFSDNLKNPEVVALPSGTQYRRVRYGAGVVHPTEDTACDMHYETHNATRFLLDSSYARNQPTTLSPSQVKLVLKYDLSDVMPLMVRVFNRQPLLWGPALIECFESNTFRSRAIFSIFLCRPSSARSTASAVSLFFVSN